MLVIYFYFYYYINKSILLSYHTHKGCNNTFIFPLVAPIWLCVRQVRTLLKNILNSISYLGQSTHCAAVLYFCYFFHYKVIMLLCVCVYIYQLLYTFIYIGIIFIFLICHYYYFLKFTRSLLYSRPTSAEKLNYIFFLNHNKGMDKRNNIAII